MDVIRVTGAPGVDLAAGITGPPDGPPLVLLPALGETMETWAPVLPGLAEHFRIHAVDLRGHGRSDWPGRYSNVLMADDVIAAVDALDLDGFALVGHSLGGAVALLVAERLGSRVRRLVVEDAIPPYPRERRPTPSRPDGPLPFDWPVVDAAYAEMTDPALTRWPGLASITAPTLAIAGGPSSHVPRERIEAMVSLIPDARIVGIDAGHHLHDAAPGPFLAAVLPFLLDGGRRA